MMRSLTVERLSLKQVYLGSNPSVSAITFKQRARILGEAMKLNQDDKEMIIIFVYAILLALSVPALLFIACYFKIVPNLPCYAF